MDHAQKLASRLVVRAARGLEAQLRGFAAHRMVFFAGLPGTGKSLLVHQLAHLALGAGRSVHLLQWDVARPVFEASPAGQRYPLTDGVTHAVIRKAAGLWVRQALVAWNERYSAPEHLLIGETPFIGSRFIELARLANMGSLAAGPPSPPTLGAPRQSRGAPREYSGRLQDDCAETLLTSPACRFVIAVPSRDVRRFLETERERRSANPLHPREREDAPPQVLRDLWRELEEVAGRLGISAPSDDYDPVVYRRVYETILRHRNVEIVPLDVILPTGALSVYDFAVDPLNLVPTEDETGAFIASVERRHPDRTVLDREIDGWWEG